MAPWFFVLVLSLVGCGDSSLPDPPLEGSETAVDRGDQGGVSELVVSEGGEPAAVETAPPLDFDPTDADQIAAAFIAALKAGDVDLAESMVIEWDRERFRKDMVGISELPPLPDEPDLWVRVFNEDSARFSVRNWEEISFELQSEDGRWWVSR